MPLQSQALQCISLRERYDSDYRDLRAQRLFTSEQVERQTIGRYQTLNLLVGDLSFIMADMKPSQVQDIIEKTLHALAEAKATWIVNSIKKRRLYGINQLGEWTAEGAIAQIDDVVPDLVKVSSRLKPSPQVHSCFFQVFRFTPDDMVDVQRSAECWRSDPERWFREVAIVHFAEREVMSMHNYQWLSLQPTVLWSQEGASLSRTSEGDVIVSLLSMTAWVVTPRGLEAIDALLLTPTPTMTCVETSMKMEGSSLLRDEDTGYV
jgi:hypothetical protein